MRSRVIYSISMVCIFICGVGLYWLDTGRRAARVHQHLDPAWRAAGPAKGQTFHTHLPIVRIDTGGQRIPGTPLSGSPGAWSFETAKEGGKTVTVDFSLIDGKKGENRLSDTPAASSKARIHYRGNSSRFFDKKSYSLRLITADGDENPTELAGMASHDEWALNGPFLDRTLLRNYLCLNLSGQIMEYAPNLRCCELFMDGDYQGIYLLMETISRGKGRIDIPKPEKNSRATGYIVRWDRTGKGGQELNNYTFYTRKSGVSSLDVRYPGKRQITEERFRYIEDNISRIEKALYSYDLADPYKGAAGFLDLESFAEYFIINEFFRNTDAGRFSTFYYKDVRGKLKTCVWDFNNACNNYIDDIWGSSGFTMQNAPWFDALLRDKRFVRLVVSGYRRLRQSVLSEEYLLSYLDETVAWLGTAVERNYEKWGYVFDLSNYNGMNFLTPAGRNDTSYEQSVSRLKAFLTSRGDWLDKHIDTLFQYCHDSKNRNEWTR